MSIATSTRLQHSGELLPFLPERWRKRMATYGARLSQPLLGALPYPRMTPGNGMRMDSWPESGPPAFDLAMLRAQLLDAYEMDYGILQALSAGGTAFDLDLGAALCSATNDWQLEKWCHPEPRLKASILVPQEDTPASVIEIERRATDRNFVQVAITPRTIEPLGRRRYWPIFDAAVAANLPIGLQSVAYGSHTNSPTGWFSYHIEEHYGLRAGRRR